MAEERKKNNKSIHNDLEESPHKHLFIISDPGSIPYACIQSLLLHEYQSKNPNVKVFDTIASYFNDSINPA